MIATKYDRLLIGTLAAINELNLIKHCDSGDMISIVKTLVQTLASAARQAEDRNMVLIDCIEQSVEDLLSCVESDEQTTGALAYVKDELASALFYSGRW